MQDLLKARLARVARHAQSAWAQFLLRMSEKRRLVRLLVFAQALERMATDDSLHLFDGLMATLARSGEITRRRECLRSLKDLESIKKCGAVR